MFPSFLSQMKRPEDTVEDAADQLEKCTICLSEFEDNEDVR